ncbi:MAG: 50S ribosomal protein L29 [Bacteroidales bacterium]|nr:50S ribosomal protein L29 [Bacteroidales bacterium]MBQ2912421.1 50S ribosomal protein L29 [Bacteroidales bacterium]MBQ7018251.1 50S ribosomal protein L29 [Bacteroidales bacterium]
MKITEIRELSATDLRERLDAERANLDQLKMNHAISPLEDSSKIKKARKNIARMLTVLSQLENQNK